MEKTLKGRGEWFSPDVNEIEFVSPSVESVEVEEMDVMANGGSDTTEESFSWNFGAFESSTVVLGASCWVVLSEDVRDNTCM